MKRYIINLTEEERVQLTKITTIGRHPLRKVQRARILLKSDAGLTDAQISEHLNVNVRTIERVRERCAKEGVTATLTPKARKPRKPKLDGEAEARLVQLACSSPPEGRTHWTMSLLADKLVELKVVESVSDETVRNRLKKKRVETMANGKILYPTKAKRSICPSNGGRA